MPSISTLIKLAFLMAASFALSGCGTANDQAPALTSSNTHPGDWRSAHRSAYRQNPASCTECHGKEMKGGITKVDCFNQGAIGSCHANGHGPRTITHPLPFKDPTLHGKEAKKDLTICQDCHGATGSAGSNPLFNLTIGTLPNGCESAGCHAAKTAHPKPWNAHATAGDQANACKLCHGANFEGGSGPSCKSCHTRLTGVEQPISGTCTSCHGNPPNGFSAPNRAGSHAVHLALPELKKNCAACHNGAGAGTAVHLRYSGNRSAVVGIRAAFTAKAGGAPSYNAAAKTCANVKCHGGQTTPAWGAIITANVCSSCHASGTAQFNSYTSGKHRLHVIDQRLACTECHDMTNRVAPTHFSNLSSSALNQTPARTLKSYINYSKQSCSTGAVSPENQLVVCHPGTRMW
jgi:predicted CxxxxCH...CXXCH cytochrome family protein